MDVPPPDTSSHFPTDPIAPYVTATSGRVFALRHLPEEVVAVLFAYYSRSKQGLRENLRELYEDGLLPPVADVAAMRRALADAFGVGSPAFDLAMSALDPLLRTPDALAAKAAAFHEKWVVGYGHSSVAEHAVVHLGVEDVSMLAAKAIEDCRVGTAFTEQSTRYVPYDRGAIVDDVGLPVRLQKVYLGAAWGLMDAYLEALDGYLAHAERAFPDATATARRGWALDRARALLPLGTRTRVGVTANGRALRNMVQKLGADVFPEYRSLAAELQDHGARVLPTLLTAPGTRKGRRNRYAAVEARACRGAAPFGPVAGPATAALTGARQDDHDATQTEVDLDTDDGAEVVARYMARDPKERPGRALEGVTVHVRLVTSVGVWRDVQRHRFFAWEPWRAHPRSAVELIDAGVLPGATQQRVVAAIGRAQGAGELILGEGFAGLAQYPLPMGTLVRVSGSTSLRSLAQFIELRSGVEGHDGYRAIAQELHRQLGVLAPLLAPHVRCDYTQRTMARK